MIRGQRIWDSSFEMVRWVEIKVRKWKVESGVRVSGTSVEEIPSRNAFPSFNKPLSAGK